jgi:carboxylesterase type B
LIQSIKAYDLSVLKLVGFRPNAAGKVDSNYLADLKEQKHRARILRDSVISIHAIRDWDEQVRYTDIWKENFSDEEKDHSLLKRTAKHFRTEMTTEEQFQMRHKLVDVNSESYPESQFVNFANKKNKTQ